VDLAGLFAANARLWWARVVGIDVNAEALREMMDALEQAGGVAMARVADQVVQVIDQPRGISIGEVTIRASGDAYLRQLVAEFLLINRYV